MAASETSFESYVFTYQWTVNDLYTRLYNPSELKSPEFSSPLGAKPATKWALSLYIGEDELGDECVCVRLERLRGLVLGKSSMFTNLTPTQLSFDFSRLQTIQLPPCPPAVQPHALQIISGATHVAQPSQQHNEPDIWVEAYLKLQQSNIEGSCNTPTQSKAQRTLSSTPPGPKKLASSKTNVILLDHCLLLSKVQKSSSITFICDIKVWSLDKPVRVHKKPAGSLQLPSSVPKFNLGKHLEEARRNNLFTDVTIVVAEGRSLKLTRSFLRLSLSSSRLVLLLDGWVS